MELHPLTLLIIGFLAQLVDGTLGMAFGIICTTALLTAGVAPLEASALIHAVEVFTTGGSALSHIHHRNVDWHLARKLAYSGVFGAILGATVLASIDTSVAQVYIAIYLSIMGVFILFRALSHIPARKTAARWVPAIGFLAAFLDVSGGGGWGSITTSTLLSSGHAPRHSVGSVNSSEFLIALTATLAFAGPRGFPHLGDLFFLAIGGVLAAPLGGWAVKHFSARWLLLAVGSLIIALALYRLSHLSLYAHH